MQLANGLLTKCVVRREQGCQLATAAELLSGVDGLIEKVKAGERYRESRLRRRPVRYAAGPCTAIVWRNYSVKAFRRGGPAAENENGADVKYVMPTGQHYLMRAAGRGPIREP